MQKPPVYVLRLATGCEERAHSYRTQNTVTSSSAERSLLKAETEYMEGTRAAGRRPFRPDSALNRRSEALSGWKHNKCPLLPLNYPENPNDERANGLAALRELTPTALLKPTHFFEMPT